MEQRQPKLFCALDDIDQIRLLNQSINEAYVLKGKKPESEQVLNAVEKLRIMLKKYMPSVSIRAISEGIEKGVMGMFGNSYDLGCATLFSYIKTESSNEYRERDIDRPQQGRDDTELDTINLLDVISSRMQNGLPLYFDPSREYFYLVMRKMIPSGSYLNNIDRAKDKIIAERIAEGMIKNMKEDLKVDGSVNTLAMEITVTDWLSFNPKPSDILLELADEPSYKAFRMQERSGMSKSIVRSSMATTLTSSSDMAKLVKTHSERF